MHSDNAVPYAVATKTPLQVFCLSLLPLLLQACGEQKSPIEGQYRAGVCTHDIPEEADAAIAAVVEDASVALDIKGAFLTSGKRALLASFPALDAIRGEELPVVFDPKRGLVKVEGSKESMSIKFQAKLLPSGDLAVDSIMIGLGSSSPAEVSQDFVAAYRNMWDQAAEVATQRMAALAVKNAVAPGGLRAPEVQEYKFLWAVLLQGEFPGLCYKPNET